MIDIVSCSGNIGSVRRAFERLDVPYRLVASGAELAGTNPIVLPGVGAFGALMAELGRRRLTAPLRAAIERKTPYLGICVGLQALFEHSEESPGARGLGVIPGAVVRFRTAKIPQIGWNRVTPRGSKEYEAGYAYFVNSYHAVPRDEDALLYTAEYGGEFCAAVARGNITAYQFHPEKSLQFGERLLERWISAV